jgi:ribonuclease P protein component
MTRTARHPVREPTSEQAHVSAQQPSSGQDPRLPPADAHPRGPRDHRRPSLQGSFEALGLTDVLPAGSRLRRRAEFAATLRGARGRRGNGLVVVHVDTRDDSSDRSGAGTAPRREAAARVGFVVSRAVGPAVTRNLVKRRLRHVLSQRLSELPPGARVVVRALPASAGASSARLDAAVGRALASAGPR